MEIPKKYIDALEKTLVEFDKQKERMKRHKILEKKREKIVEELKQVDLEIKENSPYHIWHQSCWRLLLTEPFDDELADIQNEETDETTPNSHNHT